MVLVIAHRGASARCPENTLAAFAEAGRLGADMVELDVRRTADGALAVHHDAHLADGRPVVDVPARSLPETVPLLDDALDACLPMRVNVEIKNFPGEPDFDPDDVVAALVTQLVTERGEVGRILVSSFNLAAIDAVRAAGGGLATGFLSLAGWDQFQALERAVERGHDALHPHFSAVTSDLVREAHRLGVAVNVWTVDDPEIMRRLTDLGVDGLVTNVPDVALSTIGATG